MNLTIVEEMALVGIALLVIYIFAVVSVNIYINLTVRSVAFLMLLSSTLGMLIMAYIVGNETWIIIMFLLSIVFGIGVVIKGRKRRNKQQASTGGQQMQH
jgi:membrane-associated HD superfamily phosphohydrolase